MIEEMNIIRIICHYVKQNVNMMDMIKMKKRQNVNVKLNLKFL